MTRPGSRGGPEASGRHAGPAGGQGRHAAAEEAAAAAGRAAIERALRESPAGGGRRARRAGSVVTDGDESLERWNGFGPGAVVLPAEPGPDPVAARSDEEGLDGWGLDGWGPAPAAYRPGAGSGGWHADPDTPGPPGLDGGDPAGTAARPDPGPGWHADRDAARPADGRHPGPPLPGGGLNGWAAGPPPGHDADSRNGRHADAPPTHAGPAARHDTDGLDGRHGSPPATYPGPAPRHEADSLNGGHDGPPAGGRQVALDPSGGAAGDPGPGDERPAPRRGPAGGGAGRRPARRGGPGGRERVARAAGRRPGPHRAARVPPPRPAPPTAHPLPRATPLPGATPLPAGDAESTQLLRRYVPAHEVLHRQDREPLPRPAARPEHPPRAVVRRRRVRRRRLEWPFLIVFALVSAYLIRAFVVQTFFIPSGSMHQTLLEGDRVLVNKVSYRFSEVDRGDVVVFRRPPDFPVEDDDLIKRVVALPGETVEARGRTVYVDGRPLAEPYVEPACRGTQDFAPVRVRPGELWVMGDNRCNSSDSRVFGPISEDLLVGRAFVLAWPVGRLTWL